MIYALIAGCEAAFWILIAAGLIARYPLGRRRLGTALLALTPVVDLVLLVATALDLRSGGQAGTAHSLAAVYLGFSVAYGRRMVAWADARFAHRFAGGPAPRRLYGREYAIECWKGLPLTFLAVAIAAGLLWALISIAPDPDQVATLTGSFRVLAIILGADTLWTLSYTLWPRTRPGGASWEPPGPGASQPRPELRP
jgi:hypothetical protein